MYNFAIIGCGKVASHHSTAIREIGKLKAACDIDESEAKELAGTMDVKTYQNADDLLANENDTDIIAVCTPNGLHAEHVIKSLQAGKHVLCEMPFCLTSAAAWQIIETAKFSRRQVFTVNRLRQNASLKEFREQRDSGESGPEVKFSLSCTAPLSSHQDSWRGKQFPGGGLLYTAFSNYIDMVAWLFGEVTEITGMLKKSKDFPDIEVEDGGSILVTFESGSVGSIEWAISGAKEDYEISFQVSSGKTTYSLRGELLEERILSAGDILRLDDNTEVENAKLSYGKTYEMMMTHLKEKKQSNDLFDAMKTVTFIEKIYKSISL